MAVKLTKERFDITQHGAILSWGVIENSENGVYMNDGGPTHLLWGSWKGYGNDWAIYVAPFSFGDTIAPWTLDDLHSHGDKPFDRRNLEKMIDADPEIWDLYRK